MILADNEIRVLGALLEKEMATPEYYPLTLNSLLAACNQKTNREPVVAYNEENVLAALADLRDKKLVRQSSIGRAMKYEQIFTDEKKLIPREKAAICLLLLRGPQTLGEIRGRADRLYGFGDLEEVRATLENLAEMDLVRELPRQPGQKETRFCHLLAGEAAATLPAHDKSSEQTVNTPSQREDSSLQQQVDILREELAQLRKEFNTLRDQLI